MHGLLERVDTLLYIVTDKAHLQDPTDFIVDTMRVFFDNSTTAWPLRNCCYSFSLYWLIQMLLVRAQIAPPSKKRTKLQQFSDIRKKSAIFFTFFYKCLRA
jgi:hypothetical protein